MSTHQSVQMNQTTETSLSFPGVDLIDNDVIATRIACTIKRLSEICEEHKGTSKLTFKCTAKGDSKETRAYCLYVYGFRARLRLLELREIAKHESVNAHTILFDTTDKKTNNSSFTFVYYNTAPPLKISAPNGKKSLQYLGEFTKSIKIANSPQNLLQIIPQNYENAIKKIAFVLISRFKCNSNLSIYVTDCSVDTESGDVTGISVLFGELSHPINCIMLCTEHFARINATIIPDKHGIEIKILHDSGLLQSVSQKRTIDHVYDIDTQPGNDIKCSKF